MAMYTNHGMIRDMKNIVAYVSMVTGRLGVLFVAFGLFIMAADYVTALCKDKQPEADSSVIECIREGSCQAS